MFNQSTKSPRLAKTKGVIIASLIATVMAVPLFIPAQKARADGKDFGGVENSEALLGTWLVQVSLDPTTLPRRVAH